MQIRIRPPLKFSQQEIDLGKLEFPKRWLQIPLPNTPKAQKDHTCATQGEDWCGVNEIHAELGSQYKFDRAVWAVTIIDNLLFDCDTGQIVVDFIQETDEEDCALVPMNTRLLEDLKSLVDGYYNLPDDTDAVRALYKTMLSFCIDVYSSYVLHELKHMGCIPSNYFIWSAQIKRKDIAREVCFKTKEIADLIFTGSDERMDPELADWVTSCIEETPKDLLDFVLRHNSRLPRNTPSSDSSPTTSSGVSSDGPPSTPNSRLSDQSSEASDDSPTPAQDVDLFMQYQDDFHLTGDLLRHVDPKRMAKLLPPKLSRRGLGIDEDVRDHLEELEEEISSLMNDVRKLEKLIEDEEKKERKLRESFLPITERRKMAEEGTNDHDGEALSASSPYNLRARRSSIPSPCPYGKKPKKKRNYNKSVCKSAMKRKTKRVKTPEQYEEEWKRRQDSPYPRRHSEMITGKSGKMLLPSGYTSGNFDFGIEVANFQRKYSSSFEQAKKRKLDSVRERSDISIRKKLKITLKLSGQSSPRKGHEDALSDVDDESDESDDPDWSEENTTVKKKKKKSVRSGKDLGHRRPVVDEDNDSIPPSTAEYLQSLRARTSPPIGSRHISERELQALSLVAESADRRVAVSRSSILSASSSTSMVVDAKQDGEPGWEIKSRSPLSSKSPFHASSRSNANTPQAIPSRRTTSTRPPLRRENSGIHPNAYYVGLPTNFDPSSALSRNVSTTLHDIPVPLLAEELLHLKSDEDIISISEDDEMCEEDYNFELGILSPEEQQKLSKEEEERSILDETCPEIDELLSSPEDNEQSHGFGKSFTNKCPESQDVQKAGEGEDENDDGDASESESEGSGESDKDDEDNDEILSEKEAVIVQEGRNIPSGKITRTAFRLPIPRPSELFDEEAEAEEARDADAALLRLQSSIALDTEQSFEGESEDEIHFVQGLFEDCGFVVHRPGSPIPRKAVIFPSVPPAAGLQGGNQPERAPRKLQKRSRKDDKSQNAGTKSKARSFSSMIANLGVEFSKSSSITILKPETSTRETTPLSHPAIPPMLSATTPISNRVEHRPVTKVYPNRRGNGINVPASPRDNDGSTPYRTGTSIPRHNSPYRSSSTSERTDAPVGVHMFLDSLLRSNTEDESKNNESAHQLGRQAYQVSSRCEVPSSNSKETTYQVRSPVKNDMTVQIPLSPVKGIKQKRYPGMLLSPEQKSKEKHKEIVDSVDQGQKCLSRQKSASSAIDMPDGDSKSERNTTTSAGEEKVMPANF